VSRARGGQPGNGTLQDWEERQVSGMELPGQESVVGVREVQGGEVGRRKREQGGVEGWLRPGRGHTQPSGP
jgi:hypothetical protein